MSDPRDLILEYALPLVPFDGWSDYTLRQAAKRAGVDEGEVKRLFPGGAEDAVEYFFTREDEALAEACPESTLKEKRVPDRIELLILTRLERFTKYKEAVRRAIATRVLPWNAPATFQALYHTVDTMWRLAGDSSIDFSFYTKRMTLAGLYSSTLLYWLNDNSENMANTREFLKRRLADIAAFGKRKKAIQSKLKMA